MLKRSLLLIYLVVGIPLIASEYFLSLSADTTKFDYAETENTQLLDTEKAGFGRIGGFSFTLEPRYNGWYVQSSYDEGNTDYVGSLLNSQGVYGSYKGITANVLEEYQVGYKITSRDSRGDSMIPLTIGIGYRYWLRQLGYDELYQWGYYHIGIGYHYRLSPSLTIGADTAYRIAFNPKMNETLHEHTFKLKNVYSYKISLPLELKLNRRWSIFGSYNYEYWNIDASNPVGGYYEPDSETKNETLSAGIKLYF